MASRPSQSPKNRRGQAAGPDAYTMVELVMTLAIIAVMSAIAIPHYGRSISRYQAEMAAKRIGVDLALARSNARTASITQVIDFSSPANGYTLTGMSDPNHPQSVYSVDLTQSPYKSLVISSTFTPSGGGTAVHQVSFDRFGTPSAGGSIVIQCGDFQKTISLDVNTAKVTVQ